jgi:hypothetical protein
MPMLSAKPTEHKCPACKGTGFPPVKQPAEQAAKFIRHDARGATARGG